MKIAILGAGNIGVTVGKKWVEADRKIVFGVRNADSHKVRSLLAEIQNRASAANVADAVGQSQVVLVAVPHAAVPKIVGDNGEALQGKIIIDATNNFSAQVVNNISVISQYAPGSIIFRAFNSLGWEVFAQPRFGDTIADHFFCGPDGDERILVEKLIAEVGVHPVYIGDLVASPVVDAIGTLWITLVRRGVSRHMALKMLTD